MKASALVSLELNEIKFDYVAEYVRRGQLPTFAFLLRNYRLFRTRAERDHHELEPWIQWPTFYMGKTYAEHGVFRLGDITRTEHRQIWEVLEENGHKVGAISPMNAVNNCANADFFIPDPWTETTVTGGWHVRKLHQCIRDLVNENKTGKAKKSSIAWFCLLALRYVRPRSLPIYLRLVGLRWRGQEWALAALLDRFLADLFIKLWSKKRPAFTSLFLNAGAHVQHHHLYESPCYSGQSRNPDWYSSASRKGIDPLLSTYQVYDSILADILALDHVRLLVSTGLSQVPNERPIYQYRLKDHAAFLKGLGLIDFEIAPRMSRDFSVRLKTASEADRVRTVLSSISADGGQFLSIDLRDSCDLFCKISYHGAPDGLRRVRIGQGSLLDLSAEVALVSIENGIHSTIGYHVDTGIPAPTEKSAPGQFIPLTSLFNKIMSIVSGPPAIRPAAAAASGQHEESYGTGLTEPEDWVHAGDSA